MRIIKIKIVIILIFKTLYLKTTLNLQQENYILKNIYVHKFMLKLLTESLCTGSTEVQEWTESP